MNMSTVDWNFPAFLYQNVGDICSNCCAISFTQRKKSLLTGMRVVWKSQTIIVDIWFT